MQSTSLFKLIKQDEDSEKQASKEIITFWLYLLPVCLETTEVTPVSVFGGKKQKEQGSMYVFRG